MKARLWVLMLFVTLSLTVVSYAEIPHVMNFQGKATTKQGAPLNGMFNLTFRIYDAETAGTLKWQESHSNLEISNGIFQVSLGTKTTLDLPFDRDYWIALEVNTDGEMAPRTRLASVGYAYKAKRSDTVSSINIPFYIQGLELEYASPQHIKVTPGAVDIDGRVLAASTSSPLIDIQNASNYIQGHDNPSPWIYVYLYNNANQIAYILSSTAPDKANHEGATDGIKRYYIQTNVVYRCIGAVRTNSGTKDGALLRFFQQGNLIMWDVPIQLTKASKTSWFTLPCATAIPAISNCGIFGIKISANSADAALSIRPTGSTWSTNFENGVLASTNDAEAVGTSGQRICMTDSSQQIDYINGSSQNGLAISVEGYYLNIR